MKKLKYIEISESDRIYSNDGNTIFDLAVIDDLPLFISEIKYVVEKFKYSITIDYSTGAMSVIAKIFDSSYYTVCVIDNINSNFLNEAYKQKLDIDMTSVFKIGKIYNNLETEIKLKLELT